MDHSTAMKSTHTSSPLKIDGIMEIENILRLINKNHAKDNKKKDVNYSIGSSDPLNVFKVAEKGSKVSNIIPVGASSTTTIGIGFGKMNKNSESANSDTVEILRRMLDKTLQALKVSQTKITEANKRHEASQLEIQKLQDEIRNLRAQINPPQLQLMKGISSLSTGNKRRRLNSPSSSESGSRSTSSSRRHSSRRSDSPPQLSPAFIPRPVSTSVHSSSTRARYDSPNSSSNFSECYDSDSRHSNNFSHDFDLEETQFPDVSKCSTNLKCKTSAPISDTFHHKISSNNQSNSGDSKKLAGKTTLKSNMKNTSHLMNVANDSSKHSKTGKNRRSHLNSSVHRSYSSATYSKNMYRMSLSSPSVLHSPSTVRSAFAAANNSSGLNTSTIKPLLLQTFSPIKNSSENCNSSCKITRSSSLNRNKPMPESVKLISKQYSTSLSGSALPSKSTGVATKQTRKYINLGPPVLENNAEPESEEEFDAFTFAKNDDDDSEELVDIDDDLPEIPPALPMASSTSKKVEGSSSSGILDVSSASSKFKLSHTYGNSRADSVGLKMPNIQSQSSTSIPSTPLSSVGSNKSMNNKMVKSSSGRLDLSKFKSLHSCSRSSNSGSGSGTKTNSRTEKSSRTIRHSLPSIRKYMEKQEEPRICTRIHIVNPFPTRNFDKKIDYSYYIKGKISSLHSPNYFDEDIKIKIEDDNLPLSVAASGKRKFDSCTEVIKPTSGNKVVSPPSRKADKEWVERFAISINEGENCMMAQVPYQFYESETNSEQITISEIENEDELIRTGKKNMDSKFVEIPRWRERIFEPYDLIELGPVTEENLDDQVFLKRHSKSEVNERRRKRWDSQRMREESYLERLKRKREERENQKKHKRRRGRNMQNEKGIQDMDLETFQPTIQDAVYIRNDNEIPITVFGYPLPIIEKEEFELPWTVPTKSPKATKKLEPSKIQPASSKTGLKTALRQAKR